MDGENNGKPYFLTDDLGGKPTIFGNTQKIPAAEKKKEVSKWRNVIVFRIIGVLKWV